MAQKIYFQQSGEGFQLTENGQQLIDLLMAMQFIWLNLIVIEAAARQLGGYLHYYAVDSFIPLRPALYGLVNACFRFKIQI